MWSLLRTWVKSFKEYKISVSAPEVKKQKISVLGKIKNFYTKQQNLL